jgi:hypothetical protein
MALITGTAGNFVPEIWSKKLQTRFYATTVLADVTNNDYEGEIRNAGDKVNIRIPPAIAVSDYDPMNPSITYEALGENTIELLVDKAKSYAFKVDDVLGAQSDINLINEATQDAAEKMKIAIDTEVLAGMSASATTSIDLTDIGSATSVDKTNILDLILAAGQSLDELNVPETGRYIILPPSAITALKASDLKDASLAGDAQSILRNGRVGQIDRFTVYSSNLLPSNVAGEKVAVAGTKAFMSFASQFVKTETIRLESQFGDGVRGLQVYGFKAVHPDAGVAITLGDNA